MYERLATVETVQSRYDLELEDIMQIGCLATLEAARLVDFSVSTSPNVQMRLDIPRVAGSMLLKSKLIPSVSLRGTGIRSNNDGYPLSDLIVEAAAPQGLIVVDSEKKNSGTPEDMLFTSEEYIHQMIEATLEILDERSQAIIKRRFGLDGVVKPGTPRKSAYSSSLREIAKEEGLGSNQHVFWILSEAFKKLAEYDETRGYTLLEMLGHDETNYGLGRFAA